MIGQKFGRWLVLSEAHKRKTYIDKYNCICDCGVERQVLTNSLMRGLSKSCGCYHKDVIRTHGYDGTRTYKSYHAMRERCNNTNHLHYRHYGGRGITVCARWMESFQNFLADMGERPDNMTLDRKDNDGNYEPSNCKWSTKREQENNKRNSSWEAA